MKYKKSVILKNNRECLLRNAEGTDAEEVLKCFVSTHSQTDFLLTYPEESSFDTERERQFLESKEKSGNEVEICAIMDGRIVGMAGVDSLGKAEKIRHRAQMGISVEKDCWGLGIGRALTEACIACAAGAGYTQLELEAVSENERAIWLYRSAGFEEYGRNPRGFRSRSTGWQELILMRLELA